MSDCNVCLDQSCGEDAEFWHVAIIPKSRKPHRCFECHEDIPVHSPYQRTACGSDRSVSTYRTCMPCVEIHRALSSCDREDGNAGYRMLGSLWDDITEYIFPDMTMACIAKCQTVEARAKLLAKKLGCVVEGY